MLNVKLQDITLTNLTCWIFFKIYEYIRYKIKSLVFY